ncbi:MAG: hypothetical protein Q8L27_01700 [archaeon]|nr:hypothetical protein [archaeon]
MSNLGNWAVRNYVESALRIVYGSQVVELNYFYDELCRRLGFSDMSSREVGLGDRERLFQRFPFHSQVFSCSSSPLELGDLTLFDGRRIRTIRLKDVGFRPYDKGNHPCYPSDEGVRIILSEMGNGQDE